MTRKKTVKSESKKSKSKKSISSSSREIEELKKSILPSSDSDQALKVLLESSSIASRNAYNAIMPEESTLARDLASQLEMLNSHVNYFDQLQEWQNITASAASINTLLGLDSSSSEEELEAEITSLREELLTSYDELKKSDKEKSQKNLELTKIESKLDDLKTKARLRSLLESVREDSHERLLKNDEFSTEFLGNKERHAFVVSLDIRRSTELMLKAKTPQDFSAFISQLCNSLIGVFKDNYGVVDKFTGDGLLVYFPDFFSGEDAGYFVLNACLAANKVFEQCYRNNRNKFTAILDDVGIGTGVDYGKVQLMEIAGSLTVVGHPVVYACRLSGAPSGVTLFNQSAYERVIEKYQNIVEIEETTLELKHEGSVVCYKVTSRADWDQFTPQKPKWTE